MKKKIIITVFFIVSIVALVLIGYIIEAFKPARQSIPIDEITGYTKILNETELAGGAGASGLAFCFMPIVMYALFVLGRKYGFGMLFKQISFYFLMSMAVPTLIISLSPSVSGVTGIESMIIHLLALVIGTIFTIVFRKTIKAYFDISRRMS